MKDYKDADHTKLDGRIEQIRQAWKTKYNKDFDVDYKDAFGDQFAILQGEVADPNALAGHWPVMASTMQDRAQTAGERQGANTDANAREDANKTFGGKTNLEKGRNVALVNFPASHGLPDFTVSMIHELPDTWRFDIPDNISGQQLHDQLLEHLTYLGDHVDQWPADVKDAQRMFAHHVVMSLYNADVTSPTVRPMDRATDTNKPMNNQ